MSNAFEVGKELVGLVEAGKSREAVDRFYSPDIVSVEAMPGDAQTVKGLDAILQKMEWFHNGFEVHGVKIEGPFPNGDEFVVFYDFDVTDKEKGVRHPIREAAVYTVKDGKIVHEKFYYSGEGE